MTGEKAGGNAMLRQDCGLRENTAIYANSYEFRAREVFEIVVYAQRLDIVERPSGHGGAVTT